MAIALLESSGIPTEHLRSKSWEEFATAGAPEIDIVITVCDSVAGEVCPIWPGHPVTAHWGIEDPAAVVGDGERRAFASALCYLTNRINRSEEHTSELPSLMRISYAVLCLKKKKHITSHDNTINNKIQN